MPSVPTGLMNPTGGAPCKTSKLSQNRGLAQQQSSLPKGPDEGHECGMSSGAHETQVPLRLSTCPGHKWDHSETSLGDLWCVSAALAQGPSLDHFPNCNSRVAATIFDVSSPTSIGHHHDRTFRSDRNPRNIKIATNDHVACRFSDQIPQLDVDFITSGSCAGVSGQLTNCVLDVRTIQPE